MSIVEAPGAPPAPAAQPGGAEPAFAVRLDEFEGPLDVLLSLIAKHRLELTALALHQVTDDFITHIRLQGDGWNLDETTEFLVIAATLLDLKAGRLLPGDDVVDEEDLALLEARDLLFARLLQYRAYKQVAAVFEQMLAVSGRTRPRTAGLDPGLSGLLPDVHLDPDLEAFAAAAVRALTPKDPPQVSVDHVHAAVVSVRDEARRLIPRLRRAGVASFRALTADCPDTMHVVARFLAVLELYRDDLVALEQAAAMAELYVRWTGSTEGAVWMHDEFDDEDPDTGDPNTGDHGTGDPETAEATP